MSREWRSAARTTAFRILSGQEVSEERVGEMIQGVFGAVENSEEGARAFVLLLLRCVVERHRADSGMQIEAELRNAHGPAELVLAQCLGDALVGSADTLERLTDICQHLSTPAKFKLIAQASTSAWRFFFEFVADELSSIASTPKNYDHPEVTEAFREFANALGIFEVCQYSLLAAARSAPEIQALQDGLSHFVAAQTNVLDDIDGELEMGRSYEESVAEKVRELSSRMLQVGIREDVRQRVELLLPKLSDASRELLEVVLRQAPSLS